MIIVPQQVTASGNRTRLMACSNIPPPCSRARAFYDLSFSQALVAAKMECPLDNHHTLSGKTVLIIGAGRFGRRAARILSTSPDRPALIVVLDRDPARLMALQELDVQTRLFEGVEFLVRNTPSLDPSSIIVPAVPVHLAFLWLKHYPYTKYDFRQVPVPVALKPHLPFTWPGSEGSLLVSYADFHCPEDCPEPPFHCTVTGKRRELPLYRLLSRLDLPGYGVHIVRSRQLAPGVGGYMVADLKGLSKRIEQSRRKRWLLGTACRCHGIITALEIIPTKDAQTGS